MDDPLDPVPDAITPLTGYRMWRVVFEGDEPTFLPLNMPTPEWNGAAAGWVSASCLHGLPASIGPTGSPVVWPGGRRIDRLAFRSEHHVPEEACSCGFYALKELDPDLLILARHGFPIGDAEDGSEQHVVIGRVELAGKVIEHERGYRAERARIVELIPVRGSHAPVRDLATRLGLGLAPAVRAPRSHDLRERWTLVRASWAAAKASPPARDDGGVSSLFWIVGLLAYFAGYAAAPSDPWSSGWRLVWLACLVLQGASPWLRDVIRSVKK